MGAERAMQFTPEEQHVLFVGGEQGMLEGTGAYTILDSGKRQEFASGMVRDTNEGKTVWALVFDGPILKRYAEHLTKGIAKYGRRNWMKASSEEEMERFRESAANHFAKWMAGEQDEDHAAACIFNLNGYEYVKGRLQSK